MNRKSHISIIFNSLRPCNLIQHGGTLMIRNIICCSSSNINNWKIISYRHKFKFPRNIPITLNLRIRLLRIIKQLMIINNNQIWSMLINLALNSCRSNISHTLARHNNKSPLVSKLLLTPCTKIIKIYCAP